MALPMIAHGISRFLRQLTTAFHQSYNYPDAPKTEWNPFAPSHALSQFTSPFTNPFNNQPKPVIVIGDVSPASVWLFELTQTYSAECILFLCACGLLFLLFVLLSLAVGVYQSMRGLCRRATPSSTPATHTHTPTLTLSDAAQQHLMFVIR